MVDQANSGSKLRSLIVDSTDSDTEESVFRALEGRVAFEKGSGRLLVRRGLFELDWKRRLLVLLLARRAMVRLGIPGALDEVGAAALAAESQVQLKTCREYLSRFKATGLIERKGDGYTLPEWNTLRAAEELLKKE
jgi:hypothetical protein